jgi:hypothetical protein
MAFSIRQHAPETDIDHLLAGYRYWQCGDFGVNPEHPPFLKLVAALPVLSMNAHKELPPCASYATGTGEDFSHARRWFYANDAEALLFWARMSAGLFLVAMAIVVFFSARSMFGTGTAVFALALTVFEPNLLGLGPYVMTDMALTCCLFATVYALYCYTRQPIPARLLLCGLLMGFTLAAKHSGILIGPILLALVLAQLLMDWRVQRELPGEHSRILPRMVLRWTGRLAAIFVISVIVLWAFYGFRFAARPNNTPMTISLDHYIQAGQEFRGEKSFTVVHVIPALSHWKLLPESYLYGLANVLMLVEQGKPARILGKTYPVGQWFYFPVTFLKGATLGFLALLALGATNLPFWRQHWRKGVLLALPAVIFMAVAMRSQLNLGLRHILPIFPFLIVIAAAGAWALGERFRTAKYAIVILVAAHLVASVGSYPNYRDYTNEAFGGPVGNYFRLAGRNAGPDVVQVREYLAREHVDSCWMAERWTIDFDYYRIPCRTLPAINTHSRRILDVVPEVLEGTIVVGSRDLRKSPWGPGAENPYDVFARSKPVAKIGSYLVFRGRFETRLLSAISHVARARQLAKGRRIEEALTEAQEGLSAAPESWVTHSGRAKVLHRAHRDTEAIAEYQEALRLMQTTHPDYFYIQMGDVGREMAELQRRPN